MMETILGSIVSAGISGALLVWILRGWISERIKGSIQHEYNLKLESHKQSMQDDYAHKFEMHKQAIQHEYSLKQETYKAELNANMQDVLHKQKLDQLRTDLFFEHQREAFAGLLRQISETKEKWLDKAYDEEFHEIMGPVPNDEYLKLKKFFYEHQLFLDSDCVLVIDLVLEAMSNSFPFDDGSGKLHYRDCREPYDRLEFLQDRVSKIFQEKLGVVSAHVAKREIALLGSIRLLTRYHFAEIDLPVKWLAGGDDAKDALIKAENNKIELISKLKDLQKYTKKIGYCRDVAMKAAWYLEILENKAE